MSEFLPRPRIVRNQVEEAAELVDLDADENDLIRFLCVFDLIQQRDVAIGYDDQPVPPWSVKVKADAEARRQKMFPRTEEK
jgi:hypothetical protein